MELNAWLEANGLGKYADVFAENEIDVDVLPQLTEDDLEKLGLSIGARRRFAVAVRALEGAGAPEPSGTEAKSSQAERRQLTVMFCDLVGSTELSQQLDPEALRELMRVYQQACGQVIEKYEGHVAQYLGDGLMVYFGWPRAHEDDAERAIRSAMEIIDAVKRVRSPEPLRVRIGIATGPVVVGETGAGDASVPKLAVGETPNVAARIQGLANADEILIGLDTHRLVGATFDLDDMGKHALKGILEPVQVSRVIGLAKAESRFEAFRGESGFTPLVGREEETEVLIRCWQQAKGGKGQVVLVSGEPGIGKSRIIREFRDLIAQDDHVRLRYQCSPFHTQSALYPVVEQFERAAGFEKQDGDETKLGKMEAVLRLALDENELRDTASLFASLLSLPVDRYPVLKVPPQKLKELTLSALARQVVRLARRQPVLMVFEDAHWIDPTTQEVLDDLVQKIGQAPVLLLITHRLEYVAPGWSGESHVTPLPLNRLSHSLGSELVTRVSGGRTLPSVVLDQIVEKTDGVPLFVEELTKTVLESGLIQASGDEYQLTGPLPSLAIPTTLQDSLMARLDRLSEVREVAQIGACIGREFSHSLLSMVSSLPRDALRSAMNRLLDAELVFSRGVSPAITYTFKHALVRDAAYGSLLKSRRQTLHRDIAEVLEEHFPERVADEPEVLAQHYTEAGLFSQAASYWLKAGERGVARFANAEAVSHTNRGLQVVKQLPEGIERDKTELQLQVNLGTALGVSKGYTPPEVGEAFERARELSERIGEESENLLLLFGLFTYYLMRADYVTSEEFANKIMDLATKGDDPGAVVLGHDCLGVTAFFMGQFERTVSHMRAGLKLYEDMGASSLAPVYGYDPGILCYEFASWALLYMGFLDQAASIYATGYKLSLEHGHPLTVATSKVHIACVDASRNDAEAGVGHAAEAARYCRDNSIFLRQVEAQIVEGWAIAETGDPVTGVSVIEAALESWRQLGANIHNSGWYLLLTRSYMCAGRVVDARTALDTAFREANDNSEPGMLAELNRCDGELLLAERGADAEIEAEHRFIAAIDIARSQKAKLFELRATKKLTELWMSQGKRKQARDLLAPIYTWFTEGFDTKDLKDAKALLDELEVAA